MGPSGALGLSAMAINTLLFVPPGTLLACLTAAPRAPWVLPTRLPLRPVMLYKVCMAYMYPKYGAS